MRTRNGIIIVALWTLLGAPVLCGLGVLAHLCADDQGDDCRHEVSCLDDPCQVLVVGATSKSDRDGPDGPLVQVAVLPTPTVAPDPALASLASDTDRLAAPALLPGTGSLPLLC